MTTLTAAPRPSRDAVIALIWSAVATAGAAATVSWALATASGVTLLAPDQYETEFIAPAVSWTYLMVVPIFLAARHHPRLAALGGAGATIAMGVAAQVTINRYVSSGWGDGLEVFSYLFPLLMAGGSILAVTFGAALGRRRRR